MSSGLVVSRLGVQATASEDVVHGLICLRISIPRDNDANHPLRWNLFASKAPKLVSQPSILPLPLPLAVRSSSTPRTSRPRALAIASTLLGLPSPSSYPPARQSPAPRLEVSSSSGQVCVVLDPAAKGRAKSAGGQSSGKADWVIIMEFERPIEQGSERGFSKVLLSLPKCLHSVIRFQITPPSAGPSTAGEVSIMTEPKMLALPPSTFSSPALPYPRKVNGQIGYEDGWEDGEDLRDGQISDGESEDDDPGSWLEGRFQATAQLRLEWSFASTSHVNTLQVSPLWDAQRPSIHLLYENVLSGTSADQLMPIDIVVPDGWGWKDLDICGPNLVSWRSTDSDRFNVHLRDYDEEEEEGPDDSFSTIRNLRPQPRTALGPRTHTSASLMKQTLPVAGDLNVDDFSFEMTGGDNLTIPASTGSGGSRPGTPGRFSPGPNSPIGSTHGPSGIQEPVDARFFDLIFSPDGEDDRTFVLEGTLVPLSPLTLVSSSIALRIPLVRTTPTTECLIQCPSSTLANGGKDEAILDTTGETVGTFTWTDSSGFPIQSAVSEPINGYIRIRLFRDQWGARSMSIIFPWPGRSSEIAFRFASDGPIRIKKADIEGIAVPRCVSRTEDGEQEVRLGRGPVARLQGRLAEVALEFSGSDGFVPLPRMPDAQGELSLELRGDGWDTVTKHIQAPFTRSKTSPNTFHAKLPLTTALIPTSTTNTTPSSRSRTRTLFSLNTFFYLFILWLIISLGQQVQRLRTELSFVAEEARDLRMYGFDRRQPEATTMEAEPTRIEEGAVATILPDGTDLQITPINEGVNTGLALGGERSLGRVVFGHSGWGVWANHPTVRTLGKGVTRLWEAFVWLLGGS